MVWAELEMKLFFLRQLYTMELYEQEKHVRKLLVICTAQVPGGILLNKLKYSEVMLNILEFSLV